MKPVVVIGAGPAGLMAADVLSAAGVPVDLYDAMSSPARKLLRAGVGGLNLTHSEAPERFIERYGEAQPAIARWLAAFGQDDVRRWAQTLGIDTFIGSSGRVFPVGMKAAPLLRAWLERLRAQGVRLHLRHRWQGWDEQGALHFLSPEGSVKVSAGETAATVLALGGASWSRLGSDGAWVPWLAARQIAFAPFQPANVGMTALWSAHLRARHERQALKNVRLSIGGFSRIGECLITQHGLEGGLIYAAGAELRQSIARDGQAVITLDLLPERSVDDIAERLRKPRGRDSLANHWRRQLRLEGGKTALLREVATPEQLHDPAQLAMLLKALPIRLTGTRPLDEAISSAGGVRLDELNDALMLTRCPGLFCAGEMLDWDAPTGGYLLTACLASGVVAGQGVLDWIRRPAS